MLADSAPLASSMQPTNFLGRDCTLEQTSILLQTCKIWKFITPNIQDLEVCVPFSGLRTGQLHGYCFYLCASFGLEYKLKLFPSLPLVSKYSGVGARDLFFVFCCC